MDKGTAFYAAMVQAWVDTQRERDRWGLIISTGGAGLLFFLRLAAGAHTFRDRVLFSAALVAFLMACVLFLAILKRDTEYIQKVVRGETSAPDRVLKALDFWAFSFLYGGLLWAFLLACSR